MIDTKFGTAASNFRRSNLIIDIVPSMKSGSPNTNTNTPSLTQEVSRLYIPEVFPVSHLKNSKFASNSSVCVLCQIGHLS